MNTPKRAKRSRRLFTAKEKKEEVEIDRSLAGTAGVTAYYSTTRFIDYPVTQFINCSTIMLL
jgi:hypothetical protein